MRHPTNYLKRVFVTLALFANACGTNSESDTHGTSIPTDTSEQEDSTNPDIEPSDQLNDINEIIESVRADYGLPAMGGAIVTADAIIALGVAGATRIDGPSLTPEDSWRPSAIGSGRASLYGQAGSIGAKATNQPDRASQVRFHGVLARGGLGAPAFRRIAGTVST